MSDVFEQDFGDFTIDIEELLGGTTGSDILEERGFLPTETSEATRFGDEIDRLLGRTRGLIGNVEADLAKSLGLIGEGFEAGTTGQRRQAALRAGESAERARLLGVRSGFAGSGAIGREQGRSRRDLASSLSESLSGLRLGRESSEFSAEASARDQRNALIDALGGDIGSILNAITQSGISIGESDFDPTAVVPQAQAETLAGFTPEAGAGLGGGGIGGAPGGVGGGTGANLPPSAWVGITPAQRQQLINAGFTPPPGL